MNRVVMLLCCVVVMMMVVVPMMAQNAPRRRVSNAVATRRYQAWMNWKRAHGKQYAPWEEMYRQRVFFQNMWASMRHNARYPVSVSYTRGINQFSDMTLDEYKAYNRLMPTSRRSKSICNQVAPSLGDESLPDTVDWRTKGYVTPVKNQGQCGSCWAFSTTGSVEGQHFNQTGHLLSLSEQQLVDCSGPDGNQGCDGGLMDQGFEYIMGQPGGLETEAEYPYIAQDGNCSAQASKEKARITSCYDLPEGNEQALKRAVATVGPISVAIDASHNSFQSYDGGVYYEPMCSTTKLDHGVLVVGYGTYQGTPYWLVKNSWSSNWGMNGYIMMIRNKGNNCGIASMASYPLA